MIKKSRIHYRVYSRFFLFILLQNDNYLSFQQVTLPVVLCSLDKWIAWHLFEGSSADMQITLTNAPYRHTNNDNSRFYQCEIRFFNQGRLSFFYVCVCLHKCARRLSNINANKHQSRAIKKLLLVYIFYTLF